MSCTDNALAEIERLRAQVRQLQQERERERKMWAGLERLGQQASFWDGTPERLSNLASKIRDAFGYKAVAFSFFEAGTLHRRVIDPPDAEFPTDLPAQDLDQAIEENQPLLSCGTEAGVLIVPLVTKMQRVGVIEIAFDGPPVSEWCDLWRLLGPPITSNIIGVRLVTQVEEARRRQQLLHDIIGHLTSGLNLDKMLTDVLALTIPYTGADDGSIMFLNDQMQVVNHILIRKQLSREEEKEVIRNVLDKGLGGWIIKNKKATIISDTHTDGRWITLPNDPDNVRSVLAAPIQRSNRIRGLLFLVHHEPDHFDDDHLAFLSSVADQAAVAVENAYLLDQTQRRIDALALINEISQAASSLHLNDVLRIVTQRIVEALQVRRCAVFLLDNTKTQLVLRAVNNPDVTDDNMNLAMSLADRPHINRAVETQRPVEIRDVFADERLRFFWKRARELDIKAQLAVPLITKQQVIGAISIGRSSSNPFFTESEIELCQTIAHQAANAIENARLYEEAQRRAESLRLVNMVSHDIGAILDIDLLLWEVVRLIRETLDCYHVAIALIEQDELVFKSGINYLYRSMSKVHLSLKGEGEGIAGWVAKHGRSLLVPDVLEDPRYELLAELPDTRSELAVPLKVPERAQGGLEGSNRIIGVLDVRSTQVNAFSPDDQDLLEALTAQVAVAVESARLFGRVREERATLEAIIDGTGDAIIVTDTADRILLFNPAARDAFLDGEALEHGASFSQVVHNQALLDFWSDIPQQEVRSTEIPLLDGRTFYAGITFVPEVGKVAVMQDITYLKQLDEMKSDFVSTVSHDLRSPLQVIQTSAELLPRLGELNQEQQREVEHIMAIVRRISNLVQNLLDIGRIEAGVDMNVELCAIDEIIASAAGSSRALAQAKGLDFVVDLPRALPLVKGNPLRLDQVISNLVQNAIKFTPEGSITVAAWTGGGEVVIEVRDTGIGIPSEAQEKLFQKFYRVKGMETRGIQGTGLGLAIVKSIIESYGGRVQVESFPRLGSTFRVALPVCLEETAS